MSFRLRNLCIVVEAARLLIGAKQRILLVGRLSIQSANELRSSFAQAICKEASESWVCSVLDGGVPYVYFICWRNVACVY